MSKPTAAEFEALKRARAAALADLADKAWAEVFGGRAAGPRTVIACPPDSACYCACPDGPCQHEFGGWRDLEVGGEQFCTLCGAGAIAHAMRTGP